MSLPEGTLLYNRYRIEHLLGQGGMGSVYKGFDTSLETSVAIKVNRQATQEGSTQFLREAHLLASLRSPNLPRVIDYFILDQSQYLVMDFIPGDDLASVLRKEGAQPLEKVLEWARQLGAALTYLHSQNPPVIHRDIKPANIKLTPDGKAVLVDFGIAKASDPDQATAAGASGFTPGFAPPEQYGGARTGPFSDQYALAATLYALLTGRAPADSVQRLLGSAKLDPIRSINPRVPLPVENSISKALSINPGERYGSVSQFVQALAGSAAPAAETIAKPVQVTVPAGAAAATRLAAPAGETVAVTAPGAQALGPAGGAPRKSKTLPRVLLGGAGAVVLVAIVVGIVLAMKSLSGGQAAAVSVASATPSPAASATPSQVIQAATQPVAAIPPTDTPIPPTAAATAPPALPPSPTAQPSPPLGMGGKIAFISNRGDGKTYQIWTMTAVLSSGGQINAENYQQLTTSDGNKSQPAWSPDGKRLLFVAPGGKNFGQDIWVMNADGSNPVDLTQRLGDDRDPAWSPDGKLIAFSNDGREDKVRQIYLMKPDGSGQTRISDQFIEYSPTWSPDMKWLAYVISGNGYPFLYLRGNADGYSTPEPYDRYSVTGRLGQVAQPAWSPDGSQIAYVRLDGGQRRIWSVVYASGGSSLAQLTNGPADQDPAWSPDSRWIVYSSGISGKRELFLMTAAGTLNTALTSDQADDFQPAWQPLPAR